MSIKSTVFVDVVTKTDKSKKNLLKFAATVGVAALAIKGLIKVGKNLTDIFREQEEAEVKLVSAIRATGHTADVSSREMFAYAGALQKVTTFGDEATIAMMAMLQQLGDMSQVELKRLTPAVQDFATAMGVSLFTAATLVGKTIGSTTNALTRYGVVVDMTGTREEKLAKITSTLTEMFGGMSIAIGQSATGAIKQFTNAMSDAKEGLGKTIAIAIKPFIQGLTDLIFKFNEARDKANRLKETAKKLAEGIATPIGDKLTLAISQYGELEKKIEQARKGFISVKEAGLIEVIQKELDGRGQIIQKIQEEMILEQQSSKLSGEYDAKRLTAIVAIYEAQDKAFIRIKELYYESLTPLEKQLVLLEEEISELKVLKQSAKDYGQEWGSIEEVIIALLEKKYALIDQEEQKIAGVVSKRLATNIANIKASVETEREVRLSGLQQQVDDYRDGLNQFNFLRLDDEGREIESLQRLADEFIAAGLNKIEVTKWVEKEIAEIKRVYVDKEKQEMTDKINFYLEQWQIFSEATGKFLVETSKGWDILKQAAQGVIANILRMLGTEASIKAAAAFIALQFGEGIKQSTIAGLYFAGAGAVQAFDKGGVIDEPIFGVGKSGQRYLFGESGKERISPIGQSSAGITFDIHGNTFVGAGGLREFALELHKEFDSINTLGL